MSVKRFIAGSLLAGLLATAAFAQVSNYNPGPATGTGGGPTTLTGDATGTGTGTVAVTIPSGTITLPKMANLAANSILGNNTGSPATPIALTTAQTKSLLSIANTDVSGLGTASTANTGTSGHTLGFLDGANTFSGNQIMSADLTIAHASSNSVLYLDPGTGTYSEIQLKGTNGSIGYLPNGLDILAGGANAYLSGDNFTFRNAATTTPILTMGTASATFNGTLAASNLSGTNTGNQTITLTSDVTGSGTGSFATTIAANVVNYGKFQQVAASSLVGNPTGSLANAQGITLAGGLGFSGTTLTAAGALTPTSVASTGALSGTSLSLSSTLTGATSVASSGSILSSGATGGIGYATGAGGTVTQITSRTTGVTNNKACGAITMFSAAGAATWATFVVTDSAVAATDVIVTSVKSATNLYLLSVTGVGSGTFNLSFATTGGTATDAPVINYCDIKGVAA